MTRSVIHIENLGKRYRIGLREPYKTLREALAGAAVMPIQWLRHQQNNDEGSRGSNYFWALKDVSFDVDQGEVVGIIGRNGAGKSTLLKLLSRITNPTEGYVELHGRVGSLLEVGTGFHPELTGRENVYLSGSILGMRRREIDDKFDDIVKFAEIEKFLDTPVKRYSSGMYVRLAFAVAANLDPEILMVDEVLAVGDAAFQKKCLGKMGDVAKEGRTIFFVSHNMQAIRHLCDRAILLDAGRLVEDGAASAVVAKYLEDPRVSITYDNFEKMISGLPSDPAFRLRGIELRQDGTSVIQNIGNGSPLELIVHYEVLQRTTGLRVFFDLCDTEDTLLFRSFHDEGAEGIPVMEPGYYTSKAIIPADLLAPTIYELRIYATIFNVRYCTPPSGIRIRLLVERTGIANRAYLAEPIRGKLAPVIPWVTYPMNESKDQLAISS